MNQPISYTNLAYLLLLLLINSCDNPFAFTPGIEVQNTVTGIIITGELSPVGIGVWGNPNFPDPLDVFDQGRDCTIEECGILPTSYSLPTPYPNPSDGRFRINFTLPQASSVSIWLESAYWSGSAALPLQAQRPHQTVSIINGRTMNAGYHTIVDIDMSICSGGDLYPGFYRVFLRAGQFLTWQDIYIFGPSGTNPQGLDVYGNYNREGCYSN